MEEQIIKENENNFRRDGIGTFAWAFVLLWAGVVFLFENLGYLDKFNIPIRGIPEGFQAMSAWTLVLLGAGLIFLISAILHAIIPGNRRHITGHMVLAAVALGLSLGQVYSWTLIGPFVLIAIGISFLLKGIVNK